MNGKKQEIGFYLRRLKVNIFHQINQEDTHIPYLIYIKRKKIRNNLVVSKKNATFANDLSKSAFPTVKRFHLIFIFNKDIFNTISVLYVYKRAT